jgi:uncharacterized membrane protein
LLGLFTLANAAVHGIVAWIVYRRLSTDKTLFYLILTLFFVFVTIAVPVQLSGGWITLLWTAEVCSLFMFGRIKKLPVLEKISYPLMVLAFSSLVQDWRFICYHSVFDVGFLTSASFTVTFAAMCYVQFKYKPPFERFPNGIVSAFLLIALYFSIYFKVNNFYNVNLSQYEYKIVGLLDYSLIFASALSILNRVKLKNIGTEIAACLSSVLFIFMFLGIGLPALNELRCAYPFRYVSLLFAGLNLYTLYRQIRQSDVSGGLMVGFDFVLHVSLLWILSNELIYWSDKKEIGLSVLWGVYALLIIAWGLGRKKKHFRIGGIALLGITLLKMFFYDLSGMDTISKTIVLVILGVLLLIVSFLYNKYKHLIEDK